MTYYASIACPFDELSAPHFTDSNRLWFKKVKVNGTLMIRLFPLVWKCKLCLVWKVEMKTTDKVLTFLIVRKGEINKTDNERTIL